MYVCILDEQGEIREHRNMDTDREVFLKTIAPFREDIVVAVECMFAWYWIADLCQKEGIAFVLGHALYMKAIHGGKAKNDKIDSKKIAVLLRGGMIPLSYVYPEKMRATRDLMRRRNHLMRKRAELLAHIQNTNSQYNLDESFGCIAVPSKRGDIVGSFDDPAVRKSMEVNPTVIETYDTMLADLERTILKLAQYHDEGQEHPCAQKHPGDTLTMRPCSLRRLIGDPFPLLTCNRLAPQRFCPSPEPGTNWRP